MALATEGFSTYVWNNQLKSMLLLAGFPFLLVMMVGGFFFCLDLATNQVLGLDHAFNAALAGIAHYGPFAVLAALIWFTIAFFFHGEMMRAASGSHPITREQMPKIYNMLETLCISRGMAVPGFEVIDSPALNAFATGLTENTYRIVLTRGIIETLSDDELEAVIGHELTHIINRDCRLLVISVIFVGIISFLCQMVFRALVNGGGRTNHYSSSDRDNKSGAAGVFIALIILCIGYVFAILIRFALSRRREFLADAGSVELTKNPDAMMRALLRISGKDKVTGMPDEVQQMCIENSQNFMGIFATHPSVEARVDAISRTTGAPVPVPRVTLRRPPKSPWTNGPPNPTPAPPPSTPAGNAGPWGQK